MRTISYLGIAFMGLAVLIGLQQFVRIGIFFQPKDALHHEFFMALFGGFGLGVLVGDNVGDLRRMLGSSEGRAAE